MYITNDYGDIYLDISDSERIQLNANKANYIRNEEDTELLDYDDLYNVIRSKHMSGYYGMTGPDKDDANFIRTTQQGLIPYDMGSLENGTSNIGNENWRFEKAYLNDIYSRKLNIGDIANICIDNSSGENILTFNNAPADFSEIIYTQKGIEDQGGIVSSIGFIAMDDETNSVSIIESDKIETSNNTRLISLNLEEGVVIQSPDGSKQLSLNEEGHFSIYDSEKGLATLDLEVNNSKMFLKNGYADGALMLTDENGNAVSTSSVHLPYFENGTVKNSSTQIGSDESFIYLKEGEFTKSNATIGSETSPIYLKDGYFYQCEHVLDVDISGKASYDGEGNEIASTYVTLATPQTISGNKTFSGQIILTESVNYGENLPTAAENGQIFFKPKNDDINNGGDTTQYDYLPITGGIVDGNITADNFIGNLTGSAESTTKVYINSTVEDDKYYIIGSKTTGNSQLYRALNPNGTQNTTGVYFNGATGVLFGAAWNDYAEYRRTEENIQAGNVVIETGRGDLVLSSERLQPGAEVVSDTFGFAIGETSECKTPIAVSGRVLVYTNEDRNSYKPGDAVCSGPCGTVSKMTREEIKEYPDRIVGTVSEIPEYDKWGYNNIAVRERIWIRIR